MLKLLIDHQTFSMQRYGGISRYFANIHHTVNHRENIQSEIGVLYTKNYYLKDDHTLLGNPVGKYLLKKDSKRYRWNMRYSKYLIQKDNFDLLHPSYYHPYFLPYIKKPFVITVHDMIHERFPEYFDPNDVYVKYKRLCVESATHIIAISASTKKDLQEILHVPDEKITVVHHGYQMTEENAKDVAQEIEEFSNTDYLLYVGERRGYKNFPMFLKAISPLLQQEKLKLVCAGGGTFGGAEIELLLRLNISDKVTQISATDEQLKSFYKNAKAFIFPSLYEGFGLPILEAFKYNCPVIASDQACFKEIGQDAIAYFDPLDQHSILSVTEQVLHNNLLAMDFVKKGQQQLLKFPMQLCMDKTLSVYKKMISKI